MEKKPRLFCVAACLYLCLPLLSYPENIPIPEENTKYDSSNIQQKTNSIPCEDIRSREITQNGQNNTPSLETIEKYSSPETSSSRTKHRPFVHQAKKLHKEEKDAQEVAIDPVTTPKNEFILIQPYPEVADAQPTENQSKAKTEDVVLEQEATLTSPENKFILIQPYPEVVVDTQSTEKTSKDDSQEVATELETTITPSEHRVILTDPYREAIEESQEIALDASVIEPQQIPEEESLIPSSSIRSRPRSIAARNSKRKD